MDHKFKIGDKVKLISGGPLMTISSVKMENNLGGPATFKGKFEVSWFNNNVRELDLFHQDALMSVD